MPFTIGQHQAADIWSSTRPCQPAAVVAHRSSHLQTSMEVQSSKVRRRSERYRHNTQCELYWQYQCVRWCELPEFHVVVRRCRDHRHARFTGTKAAGWFADTWQQPAGYHSINLINSGHQGSYQWCCLISNHGIITANVTVCSPKPTVAYSRRQLRKVDPSTFESTIHDSELFFNPTTGTDNYTEQCLNSSTWWRQCITIYVALQSQ